jgi:hypothetical protein
VTAWGKRVIREIDAPARIHLIQSFSDEHGGLGSHPMAPTWPQQTLSTILFQDFGPKTLITIYWAPYDATEIERKTFLDGMTSMNQGWSGTLDRLDVHLKEDA